MLCRRHHAVIYHYHGGIATFSVGTIFESSPGEARKKAERWFHEVESPKPNRDYWGCRMSVKKYCPLPDDIEDVCIDEILRGQDAAGELPSFLAEFEEDIAKNPAVF